MNKVKSFKQYLIERTSSILYHSTSLRNAVRILDSNTFQLSPVIQSSLESKHNNSKNYFMSFSRNKNSSFVQGVLRDDTSVVTFIINGDKISHQYSGRAVNYFGDFANKYHYNEFEDRITSNKPDIPDAASYIISIHCYIPQDYRRYGNMLYNLRKDAEKFNIPIKFYTNRKDFLILNTNKSIVPDERTFDNSRVVDEPIQSNLTHKIKIDFDSLISIISSTPGKLNSKDKTTLSYLMDDDYRNRFGNMVLFYLKSRDTDRDDVKKYFEILKNSNSKTIEELLNKVVRVYGKS